MEPQRPSLYYTDPEPTSPTSFKPWELFGIGIDGVIEKAVQDLYFIYRILRDQRAWPSGNRGALEQSASGHIDELHAIRTALREWPIFKRLTLYSKVLTVKKGIEDLRWEVVRTSQQQIAAHNQAVGILNLPEAILVRRRGQEDFEQYSDALFREQHGPELADELCGIIQRASNEARSRNIGVLIVIQTNTEKREYVLMPERDEEPSRPPSRLVTFNPFAFADSLETRSIRMEDDEVVNVKTSEFSLEDAHLNPGCTTRNDND